jgi:uncharacterized protein YegJ (DUF2314 family)
MTGTKRLLLLGTGCAALVGVMAVAIGVVWWRGLLPLGGGRTFVPPGPVRGATASFELAFYFRPESASDPLKAVDGLLASEFTMFSKADGAPGPVSRMQVRARILSDVAKSYAAPDRDHLKHFGRGLSAAQIEGLQESRQVLILNFEVPGAEVWEGARAAERLISAVAQATGGLIWDESSREAFTPASWEERRLLPWTGTVPNVSKHTMIHSYQHREAVRSVTVGMEKFALPDLVIEKSSWSLNRNVGHFINLTAQALAEGAEVGAGGELRLRLSAIRDAEVREPQVQAHLGQETAAHEFFGASQEPAVRRAGHDEELLAARERARAHLPALHKAFLAGLPPGAYLLLKAPFETPSGDNEWMWVEVTSWRGKQIGGILQNDPEDVVGLSTGSTVKADEDQVFDYVLHHADGTEEGNETGRILAARQERDGKANDAREPSVGGTP